ncbi:EAF domain-containing protein [Citrus sinensis]|uniref:EAF domain-containing protein n=1 Tax=Citrus sinensis TaxID=2711 RepID=A0ACB8K289_CITSI|nr:EAF domain-containing protein [Citrus sinensis]
MANNSEEPSTAPEPGQWYNIKLGPSFNDNHHQQSHHSPKFCTLRYEFKPASIDNSQPGLLHKNRDNRVTVEYQNNQHGKPKVIFEGVSEDYRDNDAVLFFDGETFRLERLHRAVKRLRHVRLPGEPAATAASTMTTSVVPVAESYSTPVGTGSKPQPSNTGTVHEAVSVQVEQIDIGNSGNSESKSGKDMGSSPPLPNPSTSSPEPKNFEPEENVDIVDDSDDSCEAARGSTYEKESRPGLDIDINLPHQMDMDDEIAVDVSDDYPDKGPNAAEALRAQVNAEGREESSSSSSSSDSESTGTESGSASGSESASVSTSTDSESSGADSVNSI